ncbi:MAG: tetratricopeptide repeat protein, partial [Gammaproteobacteria bacterium]|nr:tetratricopeptide repeat protein [Gammaproteobacteria bacterium]
MPTETLILIGALLFVAAALGWLVARLTQKGEHEFGRGNISAEYFKGLNFLLNEQPDKALEVFIRMVEVDSDTIETHFALGSLFRRRGEVDRAIRIHQNLIARPNLHKRHRSQALYELGEDYMKAGLFDRAENLFMDLANNRLYVDAALRHLVTIYEQQKDWEQAINVYRQLESLTGVNRKNVIAQYFCELAEVSLNKGELRAALKNAKRALSFDKTCVRASMQLAKIADREIKPKDAVKHYKHTLELDIEFALEVLPKLSEIFERQGNLEGFSELLRGLRQKAKADHCIALA